MTTLFSFSEIRERITSGHYDGPDGSAELSLDLGMTIPKARASRYKGLLAEVELSLLHVTPDRKNRWLLATDLYAAFAYAAEPP